MIPAVGRRLARLTPLAVEAARVRMRSARGVPAPDDLVGLQAAAGRAGGLPSLLAESIASYTLVPPPPVGGRGDSSAGGRRHQLSSDGRLVTRPAVDHHLRLDLSLVDGLLSGVVRLGSSRVAYALAVFRQLVADVARNGDPEFARANAIALAATMAALGAPDAITVAPLRSTSSTALELVVPARSAAESVALVSAALFGAGVAHGRLGVVPGGSTDVTIPYWETARRVPPTCIDYVGDLLVLAADPHSGRLDDAVAGGSALGVPADALRTNLPRLLQLLRPVADGFDRPAPTVAADDVADVPEALGLVYALSDVLALRRWVGA